MLIKNFEATADNKIMSHPIGKQDPANSSIIFSIHSYVLTAEFGMKRLCAFSVIALSVAFSASTIAQGRSTENVANKSNFFPDQSLPSDSEFVAALEHTLRQMNESSLTNTTAVRSYRFTAKYPNQDPFTIRIDVKGDKSIVTSKELKRHEQGHRLRVETRSIKSAECVDIQDWKLDNLRSSNVDDGVFGMLERQSKAGYRAFLLEGTSDSSGLDRTTKVFFRLSSKIPSWHHKQEPLKF